MNYCKTQLALSHMPPWGPELIQKDHLRMPQELPIQHVHATRYTQATFDEIAALSCNWAFKTLIRLPVYIEPHPQRSICKYIVCTYVDAFTYTQSLSHSRTTFMLFQVFRHASNMHRGEPIGTHVANRSRFASHR